MILSHETQSAPEKAGAVSSPYQLSSAGQQKSINKMT
jgi:hypothetical protein